MPSQVASSEVETSRMRVRSGGFSARARASASSAITPVPLSLAPGTASREPISAIEAAVPAQRIAPSRSSKRLRSAAPTPTTAGPPTTGSISGGLVLAFSNAHGANRSMVSGIAGLKIQPEWAVSWCASRTIVCSPAAGPSSATTFQAERFGSRRRRRWPRGGRSSTAAADAATPSSVASRR
jgi:hypothetical protein